MVRKSKNKPEKEPAFLADIAETYGVATVASGVLGGLYFIVPDPGFNFMMLAILNGFCFLCLIFSLSWLLHYALGRMKDPEAYANFEPPDPIRLHAFRHELVKWLAPYGMKK